MPAGAAGRESLKAPRSLFRRPAVRLVLGLGLAGLVALAAAEFLLRWPGHRAVLFKLADKRLHCLDAEGFRISLCPDRRIHFAHPFGFAYTITTDHRGERLVYTAEQPFPEPGAPAVWLAGDSIAMGYGLDDGETCAARLARERPDLFVRNLGVDAVGAAGIRSILERELAAAPARPARVFWLVHMSDFIDDPGDIRIAGSARLRLLRRLHFTASRYSAVYNFLKHASERLRLSRERNVYADARPALPPDDHPTFVEIEKTINMAKNRKVPLFFVFYPNVDHAAGRIADEYALEEKLMRFIQDRDGRVIDTRPAFLQAQEAGADLFLPRDGHPAAAAHEIFARELGRRLP